MIRTHDQVAIHCGSPERFSLISKWFNIVSKQSITSGKFHYPSLLANQSWANQTRVGSAEGIPLALEVWNRILL